jgi:DNA-binding NarL/FixJ family response regulator
VWVSALTLPNLLARLQTAASPYAVPLDTVTPEQQMPKQNEENGRQVLAELTDRQREVAQLVASGANNKEIARTLNITERTVKAHLTEVFDRLKISDRLQLAVRLNRN